MNIDELTIGEAKARLEEAEQIGKMLGHNPAKKNEATSDDSHWKVGQNYFIRTVTHHLTGRLEKVTDKELVLSSAAWIADDGRFHRMLKDGTLGEVEPAPNAPVIIGRGALIDAYEWDHSLPREVR